MGLSIIVLAVLTVLSCILFEYSKLPSTLKNLTASYKEQFQIMSNKELSDEAKQKMLFQQISKQLKLIGKLILGIFLFVLPFLSLFVLEKLDGSLNPDILLTWWGLLTPIAVVILYMIFKKNYGRLFGNR
ncbi:hypothetical protein [Flagellimonas allohymeniacidonis]|uniref:Uncharacterized protein n=1 Tax=Flagellimonas allohymeniacidonis TaxID=2517819 RepID=A0A4Q8QIP5_9FLAO|nr:hypothetical protein [Allomuricauda hymeniacidonis]TAI48583.1 hypothetical protein EW142_01915 [Allomuricauda hymeniacidonis]